MRHTSTMAIARTAAVTWHACWLLIGLLGVSAHAHAALIKISPSKITVTASRTYSRSSPANVVDGNGATIWNSGAYATQWIQLDLGRTVSVGKIRMKVAQTPAIGDTAHAISVGQSPSALTTVATFFRRTQDGQWLEFAPSGKNLGNVRYVRITTSASPSWVAWNEIEVYQGVEYFGYYGDAITWVDGDRIQDTTAAGANLVWVGDGAATWKQTYPQRLAEASARGAKVVLYLYYQLFKPDKSELLDNNQWLQNWAEIKTIIAAAPPDSVAAFFLADEPYDWPISAIHDFKPATMSTVTTEIRRAFPTIPIAVTITPWTLKQRDGTWVSMFDWVGFDCYGKWGDCYNYYGEPLGMQWSIDTLGTWLKPAQSRMAVVGAYTPDGVTEDDAVDAINRWHKELLSDHKYAAVVPFRWGTAVASPKIKERLYQLAQGTVGVNGGTRLYPVSSSASASYAGAPPFLAFNRNDEDAWNAGKLPPAWIMADFGGSTRITSIDMVLAQYPAGAATYVVEGLQGNNWVPLRTFQSTTQDRSLLSWNGNTNASAIRITTNSGPSWVAWREISFSSSNIR